MRALEEPILSSKFNEVNYSLRIPDFDGVISRTRSQLITCWMRQYLKNFLFKFKNKNDEAKGTYSNSLDSHCFSKYIRPHALQNLVNLNEFSLQKKKSSFLNDFKDFLKFSE